MEWFVTICTAGDSNEYKGMKWIIIGKTDYWLEDFDAVISFSKRNRCPLTRHNERR